MDTYKATNTINGKFYIGSANNFEARKKQHLKSKSNYPFQNALRNNPDSFEWEVWTDECDEPVLEQALLDMWFGTEQCYNLNPYAGRPHQEVEVRRKLGKRAHSEGFGIFSLTKEELSSLGRRSGEFNGPAAVARGDGIHSQTPEDRAYFGGMSGRKSVEDKKGVHGLSSEEHSIFGKVGGSKAGNGKWMDPNHPELGVHNAGNLSKRQKSRGLPHGKENRVRVG